MKQLLQPLRWALPALLLTGLGANAQTISYPAASAVNAAGTYTDLGTNGTAIATASTDDANSAPQAIGFPFNFNGTAFTQFVLNTNGLLKLGSTAPSTAALYYENFAGGTGVDPLGGAATAADVNLVMPFNFDLLQGTAPAEYRVFTTGATPNRICTVQWKNVSDKTDAAGAAPAPSQYANFSFQARLFENGNIEFVYDAATAATGAVATRFPNVGLKGSGTGANQVALALKGVPGAAWSTTTFINANYSTQAHNINSAGLPDAGRTYRFVVGTAVPPVVPANDNPPGAIALTLGATCTPTSATNVNATVTMPNGYVNPSTTPATCGVARNPKDVWFTFRTNAAGAGSTAANIGVTGTAAGMIRAFSAASSAGPFTQVSCAAGTGNNTQSAPLALTGLTAGTTYYVSVSGFGSGDAQGAFTICATFTTGGGTTPPANDNCSGAIALTIGATCTPVTGDNTNGTASPATVPAPACAGTTTGATNDIWYRVVVPANGNVTVTTSAVAGSGFNDSALQLFSGTCGSLTEVGCNDDISTTDFFSTVSVTGQTPGATLYARVMGYSTATPNGPIGICATGAAPAPTCADPTAAQIGNVTATSAQISFTAGAGNVSYNVTYTPTGGTATTVTPNPTASPVAISGLTASTGYTITIQSVCAAGATGAVLTGTFTTLSGLPAPANDDPTGAVVLPVSTTCTPTNSTNVASTTTTANGYTNPPGGGCGVAINPKDVWFSFTATSAAATITVTGNPAGMVRTFSAASAAGPFTQVGCAAGTANNMVSAPLVLTGLTAGTVYYVSVSGYGSGDTQGAFTICVTGAGPATCNPVTGLSAVSGNNGTRATVSFMPAASATSYTVTYQVPGGTVNTVTPNPTASPVVINGLMGNTTYLITVVSNCAGGLTSSSATTTVRTITAAREALGNGSLSVFPNPAKNAFTVSLPALAGERTATVVLLNALGQSVYSRNVELNAAGTQARVDVSSLAKGIYTLRVQTSSQTATKSVVVE